MIWCKDIKHACMSIGFGDDSRHLKTITTVVYICLIVVSKRSVNKTKDERKIAINSISRLK